MKLIALLVAVAVILPFIACEKRERTTTSAPPASTPATSPPPREPTPASAASAQVPAPSPAAATPTPNLPNAPVPALTEREKIDHLLTRLESSDAIFIRNGSDYSGKDAASHLRRKLKSAGSRITTAREFIDALASKSSSSGKDYQVRTPDGKTVPSREWFDTALQAIER